MTKKCSFWHSLLIQKRVISALMFREIITRYGRHNLGFIWLFAEPMLFVTVITIFWNATKDSHGLKLPITAFAVTGYCSVLLWRNMVNRCSSAIGPNIGLFFHRNVKLMDVFASRIMLELLGATTSFLVLSTVLISLGLMEPPQDVLKVIFGWVLLSWFGASLALVIGALSYKSDMVEKMWPPISLILFPLSGLGFMVDWVKGDFQSFVLTLPMVHGLELLREGYFGNAVTAHYNIAYMSINCMILTYIGLALARDTARKMSPI